MISTVCGRCGHSASQHDGHCRAFIFCAGESFVCDCPHYTPMREGR